MAVLVLDNINKNQELQGAVMHAHRDLTKAPGCHIVAGEALPLHLALRLRTIALLPVAMQGPRTSAGSGPRGPAPAPSECPACGHQGREVGRLGCLPACTCSEDSTPRSTKSNHTTLALYSVESTGQLGARGLQGCLVLLCLSVSCSGFAASNG